MSECIRMLVALTMAVSTFSFTKPVWSQSNNAADYEVKQVKGGAYTFRYKDRQAMFVITSGGVIATDPISYGDAGIASRYISEIRKITAVPIKYVVYSHSSPDRASGGGEFKDVEGAIFIAHANAKKKIDRQPDGIVPPDEMVAEDTPREIELGGVKVVVRSVGRNYSNDMLVVSVPQEKVLFAVDFVPFQTVPDMSPGWLPGWEKSLETLHDSLDGLPDWDTLVPGRRYGNKDRGKKSDVEDLQKYLKAVSTEVQKRVDECWEFAAKDIKLPDYEKWVNYQSGLPKNVERYCYYWSTSAVRRGP